MKDSDIDRYKYSIFTCKSPLTIIYRPETLESPVSDEFKVITDDPESEYPKNTIII